VKHESVEDVGKKDETLSRGTKRDLTNLGIEISGEEWQ
jgi:hypothetical protein